MVKKIAFALIVVALAFGVYFWTALNTGEFKTAERPAPDCMVDFFDKQIMVFDAITICGTREVPAEKLLYAAKIAAHWLDNDADGQADEPRLLETLQANDPILLMSGAGFSTISFAKLLPVLENAVGQDLAANETNPTNARDASQEEIHHLIMNAGWQKLFPDRFSDQPSDQSQLFQEWQAADANAQYVYDDPTCDPA